MTDFMNYLVLGLTRGSMYALIALGYTLVYGVLQLINFAHSEVFMSGAFGSYIIVHALSATGSPRLVRRSVVIILVGLGLGCHTGAAIAWTLERVAYRPLRRTGAPKLAFLISAIGASFFLSQLAGKLFNRFNSNHFPNYFNPNTWCSDRRRPTSGHPGDHHRLRGRDDALPGPAGLRHQARAAASARWPRTRPPRR